MIDHRGPGADLVGDGRMATTQDRFRAADGRQIQQDAQVAGDPQATGVGDALAIHHQQIGAHGEARDGIEDDGRLPEREQARNIGHLDGPGGIRHRELAQIRVTERDDDAIGQLRWLVVPGIHSPDDLHLSQSVFADHALCQFQLKGDRLARLEIPAMGEGIGQCIRWFHARLTPRSPE